MEFGLISPNCLIEYNSAVRHSSDFLPDVTFVGLMVQSPVRGDARPCAEKDPMEMVRGFVLLEIELR